MYIHLDTVETGSPGLKYPASEESGLQERGETSSHGLKYPAPEDSGVDIIDTVETGSPGTKYPVPEDSTDLEARG